MLFGVTGAPMFLRSRVAHRKLVGTLFTKIEPLGAVAVAIYLPFSLRTNQEPSPGAFSSSLLGFAIMYS